MNSPNIFHLYLILLICVSARSSLPIVRWQLFHNIWEISDSIKKLVEAWSRWIASTAPKNFISIHRFGKPKKIYDLKMQQKIPAENTNESESDRRRVGKTWSVDNTTSRNRCFEFVHINHHHPTFNLVSFVTVSSNYTSCPNIFLFDVQLLILISIAGECCN